MLLSVSGQVLEQLAYSSKNTTELLTDACHEERECIVGIVCLRTYFKVTLLFPQWSLFIPHVRLVRWKVLCSLYRQTIDEIQLVQELLCISSFLLIPCRRTSHHLLWLSRFFSDHTYPSPSCPTHLYWDPSTSTLSPLCNSSAIQEETCWTTDEWALQFKEE